MAIFNFLFFFWQKVKFILFGAMLYKFDKCIKSHNYHHNQETGHPHHPKTLHPCCPLWSTPLKPPSAVLYSDRSVFCPYSYTLSRECNIHGILALWIWLWSCIYDSSIRLYILILVPFHCYAVFHYVYVPQFIRRPVVGHLDDLQFGQL